MEEMRLCLPLGVFGDQYPRIFRFPNNPEKTVFGYAFKITRLFLFSKDHRREVMVHGDFISFGPGAQIVRMSIEMQTGEVWFEPISFSDKKPTTWFWI